MTARLLADALVAVHLAFIAFVVAGGLLALRHRGWAALHLPAAAWGAFAELTGTVCPLTPLENALRRSAGEAGYAGGFIEHYVVPLIYPEDLTARAQVVLGLSVIAINAVVYAFAWRAWRRERTPHRRPSAGAAPPGKARSANASTNELAASMRRDAARRESGARPTALGMAPPMSDPAPDMTRGEQERTLAASGFDAVATTVDGVGTAVPTARYLPQPHPHQGDTA